MAGRDVDRSMTAARRMSQWPAIAKLLLAYARTRRQKGVLGPDFVARSLRFVASRWSSPPATGHPPLITALALTSRCPLRCHHCSAAKLGRGEPKLEQLQHAVDEIVALGCPVIVMTGGEPLLSPHLLGLLDRVPAGRTAMIFSSAVGLSDEQAAFFRKKRNLLVSFSLDHSDAAEHDERRGYVGAHAAVMRGLELLRGGACEVHVSTLVTRDRLASGELPGFTRKLKAQGVSCVQLFQPRPTGELEEQRQLCLDADEELQVWRIANALNADAAAPLVVAYPAIEHASMLGCCGGYARMYIDAQGHVCPCDFAPIPFGCMHDEPLPVLWERMHAYFPAPGTQCLARDFPEVYEDGRVRRRISFPSYSGPERLRSPAPRVFDEYGEEMYRLLLGSMALGAVAAREWLKDAGQRGAPVL